MNNRATKIAVYTFCLFTLGGLLQIAVAAESGPGGITSEHLTTWRTDFQADPHNMTMLNALTKNKVNEIAFNRQKWLEVGETFSHRIEVKGITNQKSTGRCWLFAGYNVLRQRVREKFDMEDFEFSQSYGQFWDKLEKANLFLEAIIETGDLVLSDRKVEWLFKHPFSDGGQWNMVVNLVEKYGVVPKETMPETYNSSHSSNMNSIISQKLRKDAGRLRDMRAEGMTPAQLRVAKEKMIGEVYTMLALNLGLPPPEFEWRPVDSKGKAGELKTYTPQQFYKEVVGLDLADYYYFIDCPVHPYSRLYQIEMDRDMADRPNLTFANLPIQNLKEMALKSVLDDEPVWFGCDVGKEHYRNDEMGIMAIDIIDYRSVYGVDARLTKEERIKYHNSIPTHAMTFIGVDLVDGKPRKWLVENSWGDEHGDKGLFTMTDAWFDEYLYAVVVNRKYVPDRLLDIFETEPVVLPPWDPMFAVME